MRRHHDTIAGLLFLGLCGLGYWLTTGFSEVPAILSQNVPPTFFPRLVLSVMAILSGVLAVTGKRREPEAGRPLPPVFWITAGIIAGTAVLAGILGILAALGVAAAALSIAWGERRYALVAALGTGLPAGIYVVFTLGLNVRFPPGPILRMLLPP